MPLPAALLAAIPYILPALGGALQYFGGQGSNAGAFGNFLLGSEGMESLPQFDEQQMSALHNLLSSGQQQLSNPYQGFEPIRQNALNSFQQDIIPMLTERFASSGSNAISSPQLQTNLSSAGSNLAQRLAGMQSEYGLQNKQNALSQLQLGLQSPYRSFEQSRTRGAEPALTGILQNLGNYVSQNF